MNISVEQKDALTELVNIGIGHAASSLNCLINHKIRLTVPQIDVLSIESIKKQSPISEDGNISSVSMAFQGDFDGRASLMFPCESARILVALLTGEELDSTELDDLRSSTLAEVGNILLNGVMGSLSNMLASRLDYSLPLYQEIPRQKMLDCQKMEAVLIARAKFYIDDLCVEGNIVLFFELESFQLLMNSILEDCNA